VSRIFIFLRPGRSYPPDTLRPGLENSAELLRIVRLLGTGGNPGDVGFLDTVEEQPNAKFLDTVEEQANAKFLDTVEEQPNAKFLDTAEE
jgi:hypothetical protein